MTLSKPPIDLPKIPFLPPIQMPNSDYSRADSPASHKSSSSPYASQDTFLTAHTSLSPDHPTAHGSPVYSYSPAVTALRAPPGLRKSISVDSFVSIKHIGLMATRPNPSSPLSSEFRASQADTDRPHPRQSDAATINARSVLAARDNCVVVTPYSGSSRSRGTSVSTTADDRDTGTFDESDMERSDDLSRRARKGKQTSRQSVRPGDLPMPSRLQPKFSAPAMHVGQTSPTSPARPAVITKHHSLSHVQNVHYLSDEDEPLPSTEVTLLVVGPHGCGKSTVIYKGLKFSNLSPPEEVTINIPGGQAPFTYISRRCVVLSGDEEPTNLRVLEADISPFNISEASGMWADTTDMWDGVVICYDVTDEHPQGHLEDLLRAFRQLKVPVIVVACKTDLEATVPLSAVESVVRRYDTGIIQASCVDEGGKKQIRNAFRWLIQRIVNREGDDYQGNPASPNTVSSTTPPPWEISRASSVTPTASSSHRRESFQQSSVSRPSGHAPSQSISHVNRSYHLPMTNSPPRTLPNPASPTRARSTSDLLSEHEKSKQEEREGHVTVYNVGRNSSHASLQAHAVTGLGLDGPSSTTDVSTSDGARDPSTKESRRAPPWMSLEDLLNKLLFMAVCDDDPVFISHFLLTYRRFASPRTVLLAMQKRMRALDHPTGDPLFACYAQMRICQLLDHWINLYPTDFAVSGAFSALAALIKSIVNKTYLLHYGAEFLPFLEMASSLKDKDALWALKVEDESSDTSSVSDEEHSFLMDQPASQRSSSPRPMPVDNGANYPTSSQSGFARERKASLPLTAKALIASIASQGAVIQESISKEPTIPSQKNILRSLQHVSQLLQSYDPADIAQEMTRVQCQFFLRIEPRHWLQHVLVQGKKDTESDPIVVHNLLSNHFGEWVVSLILCHDKPKSRARQIEKFIDIANRLRNLHNYSGLRAIVAGIHSATFEGDESLEILRTRFSDHWKNFQQWEQLLQSVRSHQKYRMALRNTKGSCIPALEIHLSDLIRAHEGNPDYHDDDPAKIHWAKFNMMARFIDTVVQCQKSCRESGDYDKFPSRDRIRELFLTHQEELLMDHEMQRSRINLPDLEYDDNVQLPSGSRTAPRDPTYKESARFRKLFSLLG